MPPTSLSFGTARAKPGTKSWGRLHVREGGLSVSLAVCAVHGARPGEHVVALTNQHGTEYNGIESIRRFCEAVDPRKMAGTFCAVISANPRAAMAGAPVWVEKEADRATPEYGSMYNMNYNWPGAKGGLSVARAAWEIWNGAIVTPRRRASVVLDLHAHQNSTAAYASRYEVADLAVAAGIRNIVITHETAAARKERKFNTLDLLCADHGILGMTVELGGQDRFVPESVDDGVRIITNVLKFRGLLPGRLELPPKAVFIDPWRDHFGEPSPKGGASFAEARSECAGLVIPRRNTYDIVHRGEVVCDVVDPFTGRVAQTVRAPMSGAIYGWRTGGKAVCAGGQTLFIIGAATVVAPARYVRGLKRNPVQ